MKFYIESSSSNRAKIHRLPNLSLSLLYVRTTPGFFTTCMLNTPRKHPRFDPSPWPCRMFRGNHVGPRSDHIHTRNEGGSNNPLLLESASTIPTTEIYPFTAACLTRPPCRGDQKTTTGRMREETERERERSGARKGEGEREKKRKKREGEEDTVGDLVWGPLLALCFA